MWSQTFGSCFQIHTYIYTHLLHVDQQRLLVVLPLDRKFTGMGELITGQLHRHLEAVGVQVTKVIHTCRKHTRSAGTREGERTDVPELLLPLTAGDGVPGSSVDDVAVCLEVLVVTDAAVGVGHHQVRRGVDGGQPAKEGVVCCGGVFLRGPVTGAVKRIRDHELSTVEVRTEDEGNVLHPADDCTGLWCNLEVGEEVLLRR